MELSIVVPLYNERDNLAPLHEELAGVLGATGGSLLLPRLPHRRNLLLPLRRFTSVPRLPQRRFLTA